jgi:hypothetical protein
MKKVSLNFESREAEHAVIGFEVGAGNIVGALVGRGGSGDGTPEDALSDVDAIVRVATREHITIVVNETTHAPAELARNLCTSSSSSEEFKSAIQHKNTKHMQPQIGITIKTKRPAVVMPGSSEVVVGITDVPISAGNTTVAATVQIRSIMQRGAQE